MIVVKTMVVLAVALMLHSARRQPQGQARVRRTRFACECARVWCVHVGRAWV